MPDLRIIGSALEVKGAISSNDVAVPTVSSTSTLTNKTLTSPVITAPTTTFTAEAVTATGATGSTAAALSAVTPAYVVTTGATDAGINLPGGATGVVGSVYHIVNGSTTGALKVYAVGGTINGTTGTTAVSITQTGNKTAVAFCYAAGAWRLNGNT